MKKYYDIESDSWEEAEPTPEPKQNSNGVDMVHLVYLILFVLVSLYWVFNPPTYSGGGSSSYGTESHWWDDERLVL